MNESNWQSEHDNHELYAEEQFYDELNRSEQLELKEKSKHRLLNTIDYLNKEQLDMLENLINTLSNSLFSKGDLMKLTYDESTNGKIDTALPHDYVKRIQEIHPNFKTHFHAYSYVKNYGEMVNVAEDFILKLKEIFNS